MRRMNVGGLFLQSMGGRQEAMARWDGGHKAGAGAAAVPETRRQYETWPLGRGLEMDVAFAGLRWGDGRVAAYELQMRGGGRRLRVFAIDFHQLQDQVRWCFNR